MLNKIKRSDGGFTLVELMTVMAIIAILATAIIMSLNSHKKRAEGSKALTEMSAVMQNIYLCIADEGSIVVPGVNGGGPLCQDSGGVGMSAYGNWPDISTGALQNYLYTSDFTTQPWMYEITNSADSMTVCCNSTSGRCQKFDTNHTCDPEESLQ